MAANPYFKFKQFTVWHDKCAMKVGTDSVLLGAWCNLPNAAKVLDVGAGTGLLSLMLAQRGAAKVDAVELDQTASVQARENFVNSPWWRKLNIYNLPIQDFVYGADYDVIITNPPFFHDSFLPVEGARAQARHSHTLPMEELLETVSQLLQVTGLFHIVLPAEQETFFCEKAAKVALYLKRRLAIHPRPESPANRVLMTFSFDKRTPESDKISIRQSRCNAYHQAYLRLASEFYLFA